jgi:predicted ATPase/DNA-binding XRE family transcriptional regulator
MQFAPPFRRWLQQQRKALGLTQAMLAARAHYATVTLRKIEEGRLRPSREMAMQLADALEVPADAREDFIAFARGIEVRRALRLLPATGALLISRQTEVQDVAGLLRRDDVRLVTLLGPPGVGKTRLAIEIGHHLAGDFADGVCFVALTEARNAGEVETVLAATLGVRAAAGQTVMQALRQTLERLELLLILDNCEHVLDAAWQINDLLAVAPGLTVLATSRVPWNLGAEHRYDVQPLPVPAQEDDAAALRACPSVQLFVQRAQAVKSSFTLTPANLQPVAEICMQLEGLPLAIELAAGRITLFTPQTIARRLRAHDASVLSLSSAIAQHDAPGHHRALHTTIDWSYDMLNADVQRIFRFMSVFAGGFSLVAAEAVCGGLPIDEADPARVAGEDDVFLRHFESLLSHNLIRQSSTGDDEMRFDLLETLRQFAMNELNACGETMAAQAQHAVYYARLADAIFFGRPSAEDALWMRRMRADRANLHAALAWCMTHPDHIEQELFLSAVVNHAFWVGGAMKGVSAPGALDEWLNHIELMAISHSLSAPEARAKALHGLVERAMYEGDEARVERLRRHVARSYRDTGNLRLQIIGLFYAGFLTQRRGDVAGGLALYQQAIDKARAHGLREIAANALGAAGVMLFSLGDDAQAESNLGAAIATYRELGLEWCIGEPLPGCLCMMALIEQARNNPAASLPLLEEARSLYDKYDIKSDSLPVWIYTGRAHLMLGQPREALAALKEAARLSVNWQLEWQTPVLALMAGVKRAQGDALSAARLAGAASRANPSMQTPLHPRIHLRDDCERILNDVQRELNAMTKAAWDEGAALLNDEAVSLAVCA